MEIVSTINSPPKRNGSATKPFTNGRIHSSTGGQSLETLLDEVHDVLAAPDLETQQVQEAIDKLFHGLRGLRLSSTDDHWNEMVRIGRAHPLRQLVHHDPFTFRAFEKPRGYAGDAVMMDYIYGQEEDWAAPQASKLGQAIFSYTTSAPASAGVRERRCYVAALLDEIGRSGSDSQVLAVAAGHLREASLSVAVRRMQFQRFVAMDTDKESVQEIGRRYQRYGVEPVVANARQMISGRLELGTFDLIYSTGLYDYLADETATKLTANLFRSLHPGGRLVVANFLPGIRDVGYMEMYMGWHLIYRDRSQMMTLASQIPDAQIEEIRIVAERNENVVIMELTKR